jgi:hypothetical protein
MPGLISNFFVWGPSVTAEARKALQRGTMTGLPLASVIGGLQKRSVSLG